MADEPIKRYTGRSVVLMHPDADHTQIAGRLGIRLARASDFEDSAVRMGELGSADGTVFDRIGVAVMNLAPDQHTALHTMAGDSQSGILAVEPEQVMQALTSRAYLQGYRDGVTTTIDGLLAPRATALAATAGTAPAPDDQSAFTWGLQATGAAISNFSGKGVRLCVLDSGIDLQHPDFAGRSIQTQSFVGSTVQDRFGHGTHTAGTACGSKTPGSPPRYGVAPDAQLFIGKVLDDQGNGNDASILAGINWAVANQCRVVSMSLGAPVQPGEAPSPVFEALGQRALSANTLIIAAAGNGSRRPVDIQPVCRPANCVSIMAVTAIDQTSQLDPRSNGSVNLPGGGIDIAAPGVNVLSAWPIPLRTRIQSGTSMACPHVSGIAALWLEAEPLDAATLWSRLTLKTSRLNDTTANVGAGLVQAP